MAVYLCVFYVMYVYLPITVFLCTFMLCEIAVCLFICVYVFICMFCIYVYVIAYDHGLCMCMYGSVYCELLKCLFSGNTEEEIY